jgi:hypothetical protein
MSGLFDLIKGVALLAGGAKESRLDEEKAASENKYRDEDIAVKREGVSSNAELAAAQRDLTEKLTERQVGSQEKMQGKQIDWEGKRQQAEHAHSKSENKFIRDNALEIANLQIKAQQALQEKSITSQEKMHGEKLKQDMVIARINESLANKGYILQGNKMTQDFSLGQMEVILKAIGIAQKHTQGAEGLYTGMTKAGAFGPLLSAQETQNMRTIFQAIDPENKLKIKNFKVEDYVLPSTQGASQAASEFGRKLGVPLPEGPLTPLSVLRDNVAPPPTAPISSDDFGVKSGLGLHPGDQMGLDKVSSQIMGLPDSERATAFGEYNTLINDPSSAFLGGADPEYRKSMMRYLGKSTGFDITK